MFDKLLPIDPEVAARIEALDLQFNTAHATVNTARAVHQDRLTAGDVLAQRTFDF